MSDFAPIVMKVEWRAGGMRCLPFCFCVKNSDYKFLSWIINRGFPYERARVVKEEVRLAAKEYGTPYG